MDNKTSKKQNLFVLIGAAAILVALVIFTMIASGVINFSGESARAGYKNTTFTDAVVTCDKEVRTTYGKRIQTLMVDNHSSRYEQDSNLYKIFLQMTLYEKKQGEIKNMYVNCFVGAGRGSIKNIVYLDGESSSSSNSESSDDGTNFFGIPKRSQ